MKILAIVGARPNFIKIAPIMEEISKSNHLSCSLLHTGQHYDSNMNGIFFGQLGIPKPDYNLGVGSGSIAEQIAEIIKRFDPILKKKRPDTILVVGDVNSTVACAMVAAYSKVPIIHVEAGLRSYDRSMPEEINRILTDRISDLLFITENSARNNLKAEGVSSNKIYFVGNVMVDSLLKHLPHAQKLDHILDEMKIKPKRFAFLTLHRPSNVDFLERLKPILEAMAELSRDIPILFAMHPRTKNKISEFNLNYLLQTLTCVPPQPYLNSINLMHNSKFVLTDSGGMQEETTVLGIPCLTIRENTERPVTIDQGTSTLVGRDMKKMLDEAHKILINGGKTGIRPEIWDGCAEKRIINILSSDAIFASHKI